MNFLDNLYNLILYINPYLPYTFFPIITIAFGVLGFLTYIFGSSLKKASGAQSKKDPGETVSKDQDDLIVLKYNRFLAFFSLFGYFPTSALARSFVQAIQVLRQGIGGRDFRYKLPWFLLLGAENSGKTTFIQNAFLPLPLGNPLAQKPGENRGCDWWFFDRSLVLDVQGSFLIHQNDINSNNKEWKYFFNLLSHFRVRRPIDGIILTIPLTEFLGPSALDRDTLLVRARQIYQKLKIIETKLGLIVPIYVVITKADIFKGFKDFSNALPVNMLQEIFGWSSPYQPNQEFDSTWVEEAFCSLKTSLRTLQIELFSQEIVDDLKDGVMVFPMELDLIKESLEIYLTNIFQDVGYRQAFFLRGIYFTGDTAWQPSDVDSIQQKNLSSGQQPLSTYELENTRHIAFVPSLLRDKVFPEYGLTHPGKRRLITSSRSINITRLLMCITLVFLSIGIFHAYKQTLRTTREILPFFQQINTSLTASEATDAQKKLEALNPVFFDEESKSLLFLMTQIDKTSLFSFFLPPSWTKILSSSMQDALKITYEKIFLPSLYFELLNKIRTAIEEPLPYLESNIETIELSEPLQIHEFIILAGYVQSITDIEKYTTMYNALPLTKKISDIGEIVQYIFGIDLPESVYKNASFYEKALSFVNEKQISVEVFKPKAQARLKRLFEEYILALLGPNKSYNTLLQLTKVLDSLSSFSLNALPQREQLESIQNSTTSIINLLSSPTLSWLNKSTFDPGNEYDILINNIYNTSLFGSAIGDDLSIIANQNYITFKEKLKAFNTSLTGPLLATQENTLIIGPSQGLINLQTAIANFMSMSFMFSVLDNDFQTEIPLNVRLFWSPTLVSKTVDIVNSYNVFLVDTLPTYPAGIQEILKLLGLIHTRKAVNSTLANAQSFLEISSDTSSYAREEDIQEDVSNIKSVLPSFSTLFSFLKSGDIMHSYIHLSKLLESQIFNLLQGIDTIFQNEGLYEPINSSFDTWNDQENASFLAFSVTDLPSLTAYLDIQRERIMYLTLEYAAPLLAFLGANNTDLTPDNINLFTKWNLIWEQIQDYQRKKPSNSIALLQNFILKTMPSVTLSNCEQLLQNPIANADGDFFEQQVENLRTSLLARCEALKGQSALANYNQIEAFFNNRLAGKFPFVGATPQIYSGYADPSDIKAFFNIFSALSGSAKNYLQHTNKLSISRDRAVDFLIAMDSVKAFFDGYLLSPQPGSLPHYIIDIEFRVFKNKEQGANQLLDWTFTTGSSSFDLHSSTTEGTWRYGTPVSLSLQWAANGPTLPMEDQNQSNLSVNGFTATFSYPNSWALLEMLLKQEAPITDFPNFIDPNPQTLLFTIPTQGTQTPNDPSSIPAKLYMRVTLKIPNSEGGTTVVVPYFPDAAPILNSSKSQKSSQKNATSSLMPTTIKSTPPSRVPPSRVPPSPSTVSIPSITTPHAPHRTNTTDTLGVNSTDMTAPQYSSPAQKSTPTSIPNNTIGIPVSSLPSELNSIPNVSSPKISVSTSPKDISISVPNTSTESTTIGIPVPPAPKTKVSVPVLSFLNTNISL